jgi:hypothetical protein
VLTPRSSTNGSSSPTHCSGGPCRNPLPVAAKPPETLSSRRISLGSRPAAIAASSTMRLPRSRSPSRRYDRVGSQPSAFRPMRRSIRGLYAPSQIGMSWAGSGPRLAPHTR